MATVDRRGASVDATDPPILGDPNPGLAIKAPCRVATIANIVLSGLQTIDGVALDAGNRVLVRQQDDPRLNGIYNVSTGPWTRAIDLATNDQIASGLQVAVSGGDSFGGAIFRVSTPDRITIGTTAINFLSAATISGPPSSAGGNIAFWDNTIGAKLGAAPTYRAGNPGNAALYTTIPNPPEGYATLYNGLVVAQGTPIPAGIQFGVNILGVQQAVVGTLNMASGDTAIQGNAGAFYIKTDAPAPVSAVAVFGQAMTSVPNANVFGADFIATNLARSDITNNGLNVAFIASAEFDLNLWKTAGGVDPVANGDNAYGIFVSGGGNITGPYGTGVAVNALTLAGAKWSSGFRTMRAAAVRAFTAGAVSAGLNTASQSIVYEAVNSVNDTLIASTFIDANGSYYIVPSASAAVLLEDGNGNVLLETLASLGGSHVKLPALTIAGVITNDAAGVLFSTSTLAAAKGGFGADISAQSGVPLFAAGVATFTGTSGTGNFARVTSPTFITPDLGTPSAVVLTNASGLPLGAIVGLATGIGSFLSSPTSANLAAAVSDETGTGALVFATSPALGGVPTAPTAAANTNTTQIATTAYLDSKLGAASGIATLDGGGKLTSAQIPASLIGAVQYQGTWNASTNSPALASGTGTKGQYYKVATAGTTSIDGISQWNVGDSIIFDGTTWDKIDGISSEVISVAGKFGVVTLVVGDISGAAPLASPTLTGIPLTPTAAVDTNTTQIASTAFVIGQAAAATPLIDGTAAVGNSTRFARADHVHPTDTTRAPLASPTFTGVPAAPTASAGDNSTKLATTAYVDTKGGFGFHNRIVNPSGQINKIGSGTAADATYWFDQWVQLSQANPVTPSQLTNVENGTPFMMRTTQSNASAQRFGISQPIESANILDARGQSVALSARVRMSASTTLRYAIVEWTGTADAPTLDLVNDWTSATFTPGNFFINPNTTIVAAGSLALTANTLATVSVAGTVSGSMNNLHAIFWTDSAQAQNVTLDIGKVQLELGVVATPLACRSLAEEDALCSRYVWYWNQSTGFIRFGFCYNDTTTTSQGVLSLALPMMKLPAITINNMALGGVIAITSMSAVAMSENLLSFSMVSSGLTVGFSQIFTNAAAGWVKLLAQM